VSDPTRFALFRTLQLATTIVFVGALVRPVPAQQPQKPVLTIEEDCQAFALAPDNKIAYAVRHIKRVKKIIIERDDLWVSSPDGKGRKRILEGDKWMPSVELTSYSTRSITWSPDSRRLAVEMEIQKFSPDPNAGPSGGGRVTLLLDEDGREIDIAGNTPKPAVAPAAAPAKPSGFSSSDDSSASDEKPAFQPRASMINSSTGGHWLADGATVAYLINTGPYQIGIIRPSDGKKSVLFEGRAFDAVAWDAGRNRALAMGQGLRGDRVLIQLDLVRETLTELTKVDEYAGQLGVSPSGKKVAYFIDGDSIEVRELARPEKPTDVRVGPGHFGWARDDRRILLKRGAGNRSGVFVWINLPEGNFIPALHDLLFNDFQIAPDGNSIGVTEPGKRILMIYPLE
jgi:hypothetical protein